jgi:hypothetical protein
MPEWGMMVPWEVAKEEGFSASGLNRGLRMRLLRLKPRRRPRSPLLLRQGVRGKT